MRILIFTILGLSILYTLYRSVSSLLKCICTSYPSKIPIRSTILVHAAKIQDPRLKTPSEPSPTLTAEHGHSPPCFTPPRARALTHALHSGDNARYIQIEAFNARREGKVVYSVPGTPRSLSATLPLPSFQCVHTKGIRMHRSSKPE